MIQHYSALHAQMAGDAGALEQLGSNQPDSLSDSVSKGRARANLGDTTCTPIRVADLGGRILKWAKTDEKL